MSRFLGRNSRLLLFGALSVACLAAPARAGDPVKTPLRDTDATRWFPPVATAAPGSNQRVRFTLSLPPFSPETMPPDPTRQPPSCVPLTVVMDLDDRDPAPDADTRLYVTYAALQMFDAHSTTVALDAGAREGNPMMGRVAGNGVALFALKGASAAATIALGRRLSKERPVAAAILMFALNTASATIVAHNYRVSRSVAVRPGPR